MSDSQDSQYTDGIVGSMEEIFGKGFLSPGGPEEVVRAFEGLPVSGTTVLDWGCGLGGATMALARDLDAARVVGIDVDAGNLRHAEKNIADAGLQDRIELQLVEPGPMPLSEGKFEIIFTQAALCHIADKAVVFADYFRVLAPGGWVLGVDWMQGDTAPTSQAYKDWDGILRQEGLDFSFMTAGYHIEEMRSVGFEDVQVKNESATALKLAQDSIDHVEKAGRQSLLNALGADGYDRFHRRSIARANALADGGLVYGRLTGRKPV